MGIFQLQAKDAVVRLGGFDALNCLQSFQWDGALNAEQLSQLGSVAYDAQTITPEVSGSFEGRQTGSTAAFLSRMIYSLDGAGEFTGYMAGAVSGSGDNTKLIRETDLERAVFDIIESKKANEVFDRSTLIPAAHLASFSMSVNSDGHATESYSFQSDLLEVYRKPFHDMVALPVTRTVGSLTTTVDVPAGFPVESGTVDAAATYKIVALLIDNVRVNAADLDVTAGTIRGTDPDKVALSAAKQAAGVQIGLGSRLSLIVYKKTPGAFPTITYPTAARFVKADQVDIWLVDPAATFTVDAATDTVENLINAGHDLNDVPFLDSDLALRMQSYSINVDLRREALREIRKNDRGNSIFYRAATYPLNITGSLASLESDLNAWAKFQSKNLYGSATPDTLDLRGFENKFWMLVARYYKTGTTLQTVAVLDANVTSLNGSVSLGGRAGRSWSLQGSKIAIQGV